VEGKHVKSIVSVEEKPRPLVPCYLSDCSVQFP
jgi:hypothetical protein